MRLLALLGKVILVTSVVLVFASIANAGMYRYFIVSQQNWENKLGFSLEFANSSAGTDECKLPGLSLSLLVADGRSWKSISPKAGWVKGRDYTVKVVIAPDKASLSIDGADQGEVRVKLKAADTEDPVACGTPDWAAGPAEYIVVPRSLKVSSTSGMELNLAYDRTGDAAMALSLLETPAPKRLIGFRVGQGDTLTIESVFRIADPIDTSSLGPLIDKYGQSRHAEWPGKVHSDSDMKSAGQTEKSRNKQWGLPTEYDEFGGYTKAGWKEKATGYYRVAKVNGYWWLVSPKGNPCFYKGLDVAPDFGKTPLTGRESIFEELPPYLPEMYEVRGWGEDSGTEYVSLGNWNLLRKFGSNWMTESNKVTAERLKTWGFSGIGKWSTFKGFSDIPVLNLGDVPRLTRHPDIFDTSVQADIKAYLSRQIRPRLKDPSVVGWSIGNEYDEIVNKAEVTDILKGSATPAKKALVDYALRSLYDSSLERLASSWKVGGVTTTTDTLYSKPLSPPAADLEGLRRFFADRYYSFLYKAVKGIDPNHLYFGCWIAVYWWENEEDWNLVGRNCDVIGYDRYGSDFTDSTMERLIAGTDKPILCGEFSFPVTYSNTRGFGTYPHMAVETEKSAGEYYVKWLADAAKHPYVIGLCWFQYRDQYLTGRGPGTGPSPVYGEHFAYGLVDITDRAKWDLVEQVRKANLGVERLRLSKSSR